MTRTHEFRAKQLLRDLLDFVYPPVCQVCRNSFESEDENIWLCRSCRERMSILPLPHCPVCRNPIPDSNKACSHCRRRTVIRWVYSLGIYDEYFSHLIKAFKYEGREGLGKMLGRMLGERLLEFEHTKIIDTICAIPISSKKESKRGFNQTEVIAKEVARCLNLDYTPGMLTLSRRNSDQIGLNVTERFHNVRGIFSPSSEANFKEKNVLIIDDVTTSGATLNSAAVTILSESATSVAAATIAMALEDGLEPHALYALMSEEF